MLSLLFIAFCFCGISSAQSNTIFTFAFDDTFKDGLVMAKALDEYQWRGTFYISALRLCLHSRYLNRNDVNSLYQRGHEIGGHTLSHTPLTQLDSTQAEIQVCCNRAILQQYGWNPTSTAYPFALHNKTTEQLVQKCGYSNARTTSANLDVSESIQPQNIWTIRSYSIRTTDTFEDLKKRIDDAVAQTTQVPKWVIFNFHKLCLTQGSDCSQRYDFSMTIEEYLQLVRYVKSLSDEGMLNVKNVREVLNPPSGNPVPRSFNVPFSSDTIDPTDTGSTSGASTTKFAVSTLLLALVLVVVL